MTRSIGPDIRAAARFVLAGIVLLFAFTALYVTAFHAPRAKGVDVGFVGAPAHGRADADRAGRGRPRRLRRPSLRPRGGRARRAARHRRARRDRPAARAIGSSWPRPAARRRPRPSPRALRRVTATTGAPAVVQDLRPLPAGDRRGLSSLFTVIGTLIPSLVFGVLLSVFGRRLRRACAGPRWPPTRCSPGSSPRSTSTSSSARCTGAPRRDRLVSGLLALAVSAAAHGLGHLGGPAGIVVAIVMLHARWA